MQIPRIMSIFGSTINSLQICQCVREIECGLGSAYTNKALERVIMHTISGGRVPSATLLRSYGPLSLNEILDAEQQISEVA
jgi:hypothetical protein